VKVYKAGKSREHPLEMEGSMGFAMGKPTNSMEANWLYWFLERWNMWLKIGGTTTRPWTLWARECLDHFSGSRWLQRTGKPSRIVG
jgi:hypothetical protein